MNPIVFALRRPYTIMVGIAAILIASTLSMTRAKVDVFPSLNQPVLHVCQPYGGMNPGQMEGLMTSYYEYHFLYINGIEHVESKNIQGMTLMKLYFHPGTEMGEAMAETVAAVNRSRFMMPPGTVPPFITRMDTGTAAVGYLVLSSDKLAIKDIQDIAMQRVRPMFTSVPGVSTPPPFGGNQRAITITTDPDRLKSQGLTLDQLTDSVSQGNSVTPSGNVRIGDRMYAVNTNVMVGPNPKLELGSIPVKTGDQPVFLRDVATIEDSSDITAGYALVNGRRSVYMLVNKKSDASTVTVVNNLNAALPKMREASPEVEIEYTFDQSPLVKQAMLGVGAEGLVGAILTGLMVLVFLRDWRSVIVVVLNIPLALIAAFLGLWICGVTVNLMSLGGLALAVGILVDESTVEVENIHTQMERSESVARAVRRGNQETAVPRLLAMLCILAVFIPSFFMQGAARELFVPLSLAVGISMIASYLLSSTFVPILCVWLLKLPKQLHGTDRQKPLSGAVRAYESVLGRLLAARWLVVPFYFAIAALILILVGTRVGTSVFPPTDQGQFQLRMRAPTGTRIERTEELAQEAVRIISEEAGPGNLAMTVGYVGMFPNNFPIQAVHQWTSGPEELILKVALKKGSGIRIEEFKARLREKLAPALKKWLAERWKEEGLAPAQIETRSAGLKLSFEPGDIVNEVMSFGSPTPVEVQVSGSKMPTNVAHAQKIFDKLKEIPELQDLQIAQAQDYPTLDVAIDREKAATMGLSAKSIGSSLVPATASSRYVNPIYWRDPGSGQGYIVQVQIAPPRMNSTTEIGLVPVRGSSGHGPAGWGLNGHSTAYASHGMNGGATGGTVLLRDVATIKETTSPARIDRYNMRRMISITANVSTADLGKVGRDVRKAIAAANAETIHAGFDANEADLEKAGKLTPEAKEKLDKDRAAALKASKLPGGMTADVRGQLESLDSIMQNLLIGLAIAVLAIFLLLTGYFQSVRLALVSVAAVPATLCGVALMLLLTGSTLNLQSFMGAIMAVGVAVANAILLVTFAERSRAMHGYSLRAAAEAGIARIRPILMTSCAMGAGMIPMAIGLGDGGDQTAPLGRAVLGGVVASTFATLFMLPCAFAVIQRKANIATTSLDPDDPGSLRYDIDRVELFQE